MNTQTSYKEYAVLVLCGVLAAGVVIALAALGNPPNMALCIACFMRDTAGALKLHTAAPVQYMRPEIIGIVLGAFCMALIRKEFKPKGGSAPVARFVLSFFMMIGALVFLGCPLRMILRMGAGDLNAWVGLVGFAAGIALGVVFLKNGFSLGKATPSAHKLEGMIVPIIVAVLLVVSLTTSLFAISQKGPGSIHAPLIASLIGGLIFGAVSQRTRLCFAGGFRDVFITRDVSRLIVIACIFVGILAYNLITGHFKLSFDAQPIAHAQALWNVLGLFVVGLAATLMGGCPLRQLVLAGSGNSDAGISFFGLLVGAAFAHNFGLASSGQGTTFAGQVMIIVGIVVLCVIAACNLNKAKA
jgi:hypothetical protein